MSFELVTQRTISPNGFDQLTPVHVFSLVIDCSTIHKVLPILTAGVQRAFLKHVEILETGNRIIFSLSPNIQFSLLHSQPMST